MLAKSERYKNVLLEYVSVEINDDKQKGNKPMDEKLFQRVEVDIEKFTRAAMELQAAVIYAEDQLKDVKQRASRVFREWADAEKSLEAVRGQLRHHLDSVRGLKVTMPLVPEGEHKVGELDV